MVTTTTAVTAREQRLREIALAAGIGIITDPTIPTALARAREGRYEIVLGRIYETASPEERATIVSHELAHILRGDLVHKDIDHVRANLAMDAVINQYLPQDHIQRLDGITHAALVDRFGDLPPVTTGWRPIYEALHQPGQGQGLPAGMDSLESDGSITDTAHATTVLKARAAIKRAQPEEIDDLAEAAGIGSGGMSLRMPAIQSRPVPPAVAALLSAVKTVRQARGSLIRSRSYLRPGRVEGLRGIVRAPRLSVGLFVDVSGSMAHYVEAALGIADTMRREMDVHIHVFADDCERVRPGDRIPCVGWGTILSSVVPHVGGFDATIILTDADVDPAHAAAVEQAAAWCLWLVVGKDTRALPPGARAVFVEIRNG